MARIQRLTRVGVASFLLAVCGLFLTPAARASAFHIYQADAYSACAALIGTAYPPDPSITVASCKYFAPPSPPEPGGTCQATADHGFANAGGYEAYWSNGNDEGDTETFCVPVSCEANVGGWTQLDGQDAGGKQLCDHGCLSAFTSYQAVGKQGDPSDGFSVGTLLTTGSNCLASYTGTESTSTLPKPATFVAGGPCSPGQSSCVNPDRGYCAQSDSGEWSCVGSSDFSSAPSGCASGATGSVCVGAATPPNPPISSGTPPDQTSNYTVNNNGSTYNVTQNSYSGTSPGSGDSGSSSSPGGTGSNTSGNGNSGSNGTDSSGKCPNGAVPTASGCSGSYRDNGCDTPPACFGDAVLCATAVNTHKIACNPASSSSIGNAADALAAAGVPADGGASTDPDPSSLVSSSDIGSDGFDASGLGFSRTCPASPSFDVLGHTYTLDLTPFCNFASLLGWFVLLVAYLVGLRVVATGKS